AAPSDHLSSGLLQLGDAVGSAGADQEQVGEGADLEQALHLALDAIKGKLAVAVPGRLVGDEQGAEAGAADVGDAFEIDEDAPAGGFEHGHQPAAQLPGGGAVGPAGYFDPAATVRGSLDQPHGRG